MKAVLKTKCGSEREVDVAADSRGRPPAEWRVPILLSEPVSVWDMSKEPDPYGPTFCSRVFRCEFRRDEKGRMVYSEYLTVTSMTEQERWEANIDWPSEIKL